MSETIIITDKGEGLYEEKKSRFIAAAYKVDSEEEVSSYIEAARKQYWDARHNCYAYVIGDNNEITRCSDDGEPSGTAGKPILEVILGSKVHNCLIIVTRYFGGTLLGTGGLVRAYTKAAKDALIDSSLSILVLGICYEVITDYNAVGKIQYIAADIEAIIKDTIYTDIVKFTILIEKEKGTQLCTRITEGTNGKAVINKICDMPVESPYSLL